MANSKGIYFIEADCPICGKQFLPAPYHAYRDRITGRRVCTWKCVCESERMKQEQIEAAKKKKKGGNHDGEMGNNNDLHIADKSPV